MTLWMRIKALLHRAFCESWWPSGDQPKKPSDRNRIEYKANPRDNYSFKLRISLDKETPILELPPSHFQTFKPVRPIRAEFESGGTTIIIEPDDDKHIIVTVKKA